MKKKFLACILSSCMVAGLLVGCNGGGTTPAPSTGGDDGGNAGGGNEPTQAEVKPEGEIKGEINLVLFTDEIQGMVEAYVKDHPDFGYTINSTIKATDGGAYDSYLTTALANGGKDAPDIYAAEAAFVLKYTQGDMAQYAVPYEDLGIDVAAETKAADIAQYTIDIGTRPSDGKLVALGYQATGSAMIYRRSIAKDTWGTDDPDEIAKKVGAGDGNWDKFWAAADELKAKGYAAVSGAKDMWNPTEKSTGKWLTDDGLLTIDPGREAFLDINKKVIDNGYSNDSGDWSEAWYADMAGTGPKEVFAFFGPAWLINYVMAGNSGGSAPGEGTYGDWAVCASPVGFFWGGTWVLAGPGALSDPDKTEAVRKIIDWITLDCTQDGLQYKWANGTLNGPGGTKDTVASGTVMAMSDGTLDFLGGQNMFDAFVPANAYATGKNMTQYDENINGKWTEQTGLYAHGEKDRDTAIADFKSAVKDELDIDAK